MNSSSLEKNKKMKNNVNKDMRKIFILTLVNEAIKDRVTTDIRNLFEHEEENHYKPIRVGNIWTNNYIKCESNGDRNKTLEEY